MLRVFIVSYTLVDLQNDLIRTCICGKLSGFGGFRNTCSILTVIWICDIDKIAFSEIDIIFICIVCFKNRVKDLKSEIGSLDGITCISCIYNIWCADLSLDRSGVKSCIVNEDIDRSVGYGSGTVCGTLSGKGLEYLTSVSSWCNIEIGESFACGRITDVDKSPIIAVTGITACNILDCGIGILCENILTCYTGKADDSVNNTCSVCKRLIRITLITVGAYDRSIDSASVFIYPVSVDNVSRSLNSVGELPSMLYMRTSKFCWYRGT